MTQKQMTEALSLDEPLPLTNDQAALAFWRLAARARAQHEAGQTQLAVEVAEAAVFACQTIR